MNDKYKFDLVSFGMRLQEIREFYGMTQQELADKLDVQPKSVSNWERAFKLPGIDNIVELAQIYNMSVGEILEDEAYRIFLKKSKFRKRSIEIVEMKGKIEFFMEFTEDRYYDRYEAWVWDELMNYKYLCCSTGKRYVSYNMFKESMLGDVESIASDYRNKMMSLLTDNDYDIMVKNELKKKIECEDAGKAKPGSVFVNGRVICFSTE
ncbi:MAG: helix-turn-helix domain-containing protein [Lachnospiraceae bacterium]|nr:helix-turn-helix domain-containing protein [Lachnospiraceae bacterium]